ncbi:flagellar protein FliS [Fibrobacterales bacterium]|nr:flagellar protein FliS [Fibrobacterales bacterium]
MPNATYAKPFGQYKQASVGTADRGQLVVMIYDHCIKWCGIAKESIAGGHFAKRAEAAHKVEAGISELMTALDMEKGGEVAKNLWRLYDFYSYHIHEGNMNNLSKNFEEVQRMMSQLRDSWVQALGQVRQDRTTANNLSLGTQRSYVSMVG